MRLHPACPGRRTVRAAFRLMYAGAAISTVNLIILLAFIGYIKAYHAVHRALTLALPNSPPRTVICSRLPRSRRVIIAAQDPGGSTSIISLRPVIDPCHQPAVVSVAPREAAIAANWSRAACRSSTISAAISSGAGRLPVSSSDSSRSQKMSRDALSLATSSS
jgi:hypothetical protein